MQRPRLPVGCSVFLLALALLAPASILAKGFSYPETRRTDQTDDYHGTRVADPYRWLEDSDAPEVKTWIGAENAFTQSYLEKTGTVNTIRERLRERLNFVRYGTPNEENGVIFFSKNDGLQNQSVVYVQQGPQGQPRLLLDPNKLREDGTAALTSRSVSPDARYMAYCISLSGSDWQEMHVLDVATGKDLPDVIPNLKFSDAMWTKDVQGFFYTRQPKPGTVPAGDENYYPKLYYHRLGDNPDQDTFLYDRPDKKEAGISPSVTDDGRYLVVTVWFGSSDKNEVFVTPLAPGGKTEKLRPIFTGFDAAYDFIGESGDRFFFSTDREAPNRRIVAMTLAKAKTPAMETIIPESRDVITSASIVNHELWVETLHNAHSRLVAYKLDGSRIDEVQLPAIGSVNWSGRPESDQLFVGFTSFLFPLTVYRFDFSNRTLVPLYEPHIDFDRDAYTTRQVWYESKDGTLVPMFLVHKKNLVLDGNNPVILNAYGGFNISMTPYFSMTRLFWLEQGGILAVPNLRGGGEFGQAWHEAGMLAKKQNVFDDFIAAGEYLIANGYTRPERLVIEGGSNGGLLTSAVEMQRPDLFGAVIVQVPVADMLRYHLFTVARFWIPEYGSSDDPEQFKFLYAYSPLHNVKPGTHYPSTIVLTADSDDRVHPGQARKLAATLQADNASEHPILIRVETRAGHGGGKPISKIIDETADTYAFVMHELGMQLKNGEKSKRSRGTASARP
jgi:prolyl oligopeptidase